MQLIVVALIISLMFTIITSMIIIRFAGVKIFALERDIKIARDTIATGIAKYKSH